jgi:hypothetical protein
MNVEIVQLSSLPFTMRHTVTQIAVACIYKKIPSQEEVAHCGCSFRPYQDAESSRLETK